MGFRKILGRLTVSPKKSRFDLGVNWIGIESRPDLDSENFYAALTASSLSYIDIARRRHRVGLNSRGAFCFLSFCLSTFYGLPM